MATVTCPRCGGKGLRIVWGMLSHECERCEHRWQVDGFGILGDDPVDAPDPGIDRDLWVVGDLNGHRVLSEEEWPEDDCIVWLETEPGNPMTLDEFDRAQGEGVVGWLAETEPYEAHTSDVGEGAPPGSEVTSEPERPEMLRSAASVEVLACTAAELEQWRRSVLPGAPRRYYEQSDDEYRPEEVVAVAVGIWLRSRKMRGGDAFAARLAITPPIGEDWCVVRRGRSRMEVVQGTATFDMEGRKRVSTEVFDPTPILDALHHR